MTMLDRMRRHKGWLKWSLGLVCLAFVIFYIPDFLRGSGTSLTATDTVAAVEGQPIHAEEFRRMYQSQLQAYQSAYGGNINMQLLRQLGVDQQILQQMVDERAAIIEAERSNIRVTNEEVRARIMAIPAFLENGTFIGEQRYRQLLGVQNPPLSVTRIRRGHQAVAGRRQAARVGHRMDGDRRSGSRAGVPPEKRQSEARARELPRRDLQARRHGQPTPRSRATSKRTRKISGFRRSARSAICSSTSRALRAKVTVSQADLERATPTTSRGTQTPEQIRASHILLKTEGKDDAAVKARAEALLKQARGGADFADLAKKNSEDEGSAAKGGDLDFFGRGRMVPEFDTAAFALKPGEISELVKTRYGYHIIKMVDKKEGATRALNDVRQQLTDQIAFERAQSQASDIAQSLQTQITKAADLDTAAAARGLKVEESGYFSRDEPRAVARGLAGSRRKSLRPRARRVAGPIGTSRGFVFRNARRSRGRVCAEDRRSERQGSRPSPQRQGARVREEEGRGACRKGQVGAGLRESGESGRLHAGVHRTDHPRLAGSGSGTGSRRHRSRVLAAARRRERSDYDRHRRGHRQGGREATGDARGADEQQGSVPRRAAGRSGRTASSAPTWRRPNRRCGSK